MTGQQTACVQQVSLLKGVSGRHEDVLLRNPVAYRKYGLEEGLVEIVTQTPDFTCGCHVDTEDRVSLMQSRERELGSLDTYIVQVEGALVRSGRLQTEHHFRGEFYQIYLQYLRHEREASGSPQVAFYDLDLVFLGQELDIERSGNLQGCRYLLRYLLDPADCLYIQFLRRELYGGVTGMHSGKLHMFRNGIGDHLTVVSHRVEFYFLAPLHEFAHHHRVFLRHFSREGKESAELVLIVAHIHGRT